LPVSLPRQRSPFTAATTSCRSFPARGCNAENQKNIALPLLILSGEKDDWTPAAPCQALQAAVSPPQLEVVVFPGASHGFDNDLVMQQTVQCNKGNCHMAYDAKADQETATRTKAFLDRVLH
jgi:dienelactone hydrolase